MLYKHSLNFIGSICCGCVAGISICRTKICCWQSIQLADFSLCWFWLNPELESAIYNYCGVECGHSKFTTDRLSRDWALAGILLQIYHASETFGIDDIRSAVGYFHLGKVFHELNRDDIAEAMFDMVIRFKPALSPRYLVPLSSKRS